MLRNHDNNLDEQQQPQSSASLSNSAFGMRDILLVKCKQAIEELHLELDEEKKLKIVYEEKIAKQDKDILDLESKLREYEYKTEKYKEENQGLNLKVNSLIDKLEQLEIHAQLASNNESSLNEMQANFQSVCRANNELKKNVEDLNQEIKKRDKIFKEWNETLGSVEAKIANLEHEKEELQLERQSLVHEIESQRLMLKESENLTNLLQGKCEYMQNILEQLENENRVLEHTKKENNYFKEELDKLKDILDSLTEHHHADKIDQERVFHKEKEELERLFKERLEKKTMEYTQEMNNLHEKLQSMADSQNKERNKSRDEIATLKNENENLNEKLVSKDKEIKILNEKFNEKWETTLKSKINEIDRLQKIIEDQNHLIGSYDKLIEKEKQDAKDKVNSIQEANKKLKDEIFDLTNKNNYLNIKLQDCQDELRIIQNDIKNTFHNEEEKQNKLLLKIIEIEQALQEKNDAIVKMEEELKEMKEENTKMKTELESYQALKKTNSNELQRNHSQIYDLMTENETLKEKQKEFYAILNKKINEISDEAKLEREKRISSENRCREFEEKILELELTMKKNLSMLKQEINCKNDEIEYLKKTNSTTRGYMNAAEVEKGRNYEGKPSYKATNKLDASLSDQSDSLIDERLMREKDEKPTISTNMDYLYGSKSEMIKRYESQPQPQSQYTRYEDRVDRVGGGGIDGNAGSSERINKYRKSAKASENQDYYLTKLKNASNNVGMESTHTDFLNRFKNVITKLENRLEKIAEMNG